MNLKVVAAVASVSVFVLLGGLLTFSQSSSFLTSDADPSQPCDTPLTYRFGDIDSRFEISESELAAVMREVEALWATALDKDLLDYKKEGRVVIHLVYSEDQKRTQEEKAFSERIETKKNQVEIIEKEYERLRDRFEEQRKNFQTEVDEYNRLVESYNQFAERWSGRNIPAHADNRFKRMEREINRQKSKVDREQQTLESIRQRTNTKSRLLNKFADELNEMVSEYNTKFSNPRKFDQGRYIKKGESEKINIFQFANHAQLKTVLAHEVGHAFGLSHVNNPKSVMHKMMDKQRIFDLELSNEDIAAIKKRCNTL